MPRLEIADKAPDELVPDPQVAREFDICLMTLWRWDQDPTLKFPPPVRIRNRKFRSRRQLETFKEQLVVNALEQRDAAKARRKSPQ